MNKEVEKKSIEYIKANKKFIKEFFAGDTICKPSTDLISFFMAGSAGAGKTEVSKNLLKELPFDVVRIDADEIREKIPFYNGKNSPDVHAAASIGVEYVYDHAMNKKKNILLDGTFSNYEKSLQNIERALKKDRYVILNYVYQDPLVAWEFVKKRELIDGRHIPKDVFIDTFFKAMKNVIDVKTYLGDKIQLDIFLKNYNNSLDEVHYNVSSVEVFVKNSYTKESLLKILK